MPPYTFWHTYGTDIQNGAVVLSAVAAFWIIQETRKIARRKATLDLILQHEADRELVKAREDFNKLKSSFTRIGIYGDVAHKSSPEDNILRKILNLHEITALSIQESVIDERVYRRWFNSSYIADYEAAKDYIVAARNRGSEPNKPIPAYYRDFEELAKRWASEPEWTPRDSWLWRKWSALIKLINA